MAGLRGEKRNLIFKNRAAPVQDPRSLYGGVGR